MQSPSQSTSKLVYFQVLDTSLTTHTIRLVRLTLRHSMPQLTSILPPHSTTGNIDLTTFTGDSHSLFRCVTSCPYHNGRDPIFPDDDHGLTIAQAHGQHLHSDLLASLPSDSLSSIGWSRCCDTCPSLFLRHDDCAAHRATCNNYVPQPPPPQDTMHTPPCRRDPKWGTLYIICSASRHSDLDSLITTNPNSDPSSLFTTVTSWFNDFTSQEAISASASSQP